LSDASQRHELDLLATEQAAGSLRLLAAAGIGVPERFFGMLRGVGLTFDELALPDHFKFCTDSFASVTADRILITEKDAVKCAAEPSLASDTRIWVVPLVAALDPGLIDLIAARIAHAAPEASLGSTPA
jgi:tetraacyldisaccharide 4'-kinase